MNPDVLQSYSRQRRLEALIAEGKRKTDGSWQDRVGRHTDQLNALLAERDAARSREGGNER